MQSQFGHTIIDEKLLVEWLPVLSERFANGVYAVKPLLVGRMREYDHNESKRNALAPAV